MKLVAAAALVVAAVVVPLVTATPWPKCVRVPVRCDPTQDPFATTTTWHSRSDDSNAK